MDKRLKIGVIIIIFLIISQYLFVRLVYAHKLENNLGIFISKIYNLQAGNIDDHGKKISISLTEYLNYKDSLKKYLEKNKEEINIEEIVWDRLFKNIWLNKIAISNNLLVSQEELNKYLNDIEDLGELKKISKESFGISFSKYKELIIKPFILESKVYNHLLNNYNDIENITKAQKAYEDLEAGQDFLTVAKNYSADIIFAENSMYVSEEDLVDFYEAIKDLKEGEFSKIVMTPGGYIIWYLENIIEDEGNVREVKQIFIKAKTIDEFYKDYLNTVNINKIY